MRTAIVTMATHDYIVGAQNLFESLEVTTSLHDIDLICLTNDSLIGFLASGKLVSPISLEIFPESIHTSETVKRFKLTLCKFQIFQVLEDGDYDRVIFLDADIVVLRDISFLFSNELNGFDLYAVRDQACGQYYGERLTEIGLDPQNIFNSGALVLNRSILNKIRFEKLLDYTVKIGKSYDGGDQGYLNFAMLKFDIFWGELPLEFNCMTDSSYPLLWRFPSLLHFTGAKPWKNDGFIPKYDRPLYRYYKAGMFTLSKFKKGNTTKSRRLRKIRFAFAWGVRNLRILYFRFLEKYYRGIRFKAGVFIKRILRGN